jgi:hypothetical protein
MMRNISSSTSLPVAIKPQRGKIAALSTGHLINDLYMNQIQALMPFLVLVGFSIGFHHHLIAGSTTLRVTFRSQKLPLADILRYGLDGSVVKFDGVDPKLLVTFTFGIFSRTWHSSISSASFGYGSPM